jgi:uncharacterized membrane protein (UPF0127 family)
MSRFISVWNQSHSTLVAQSVEVADTSIRRAVGLLGRKMLGSEQGLWIRPCSGVHTFGMAFAIDVVGLDRNLRVTRLWRNLRPNRMTTLVPRVRSVIELPAGAIDNRFIHLGDVLEFQE